MYFIIYLITGILNCRETLLPASFHIFLWGTMKNLPSSLILFRLLLYLPPALHFETF